MAKYKIQSREEETFCQYCGCPLLVGDIAYENAASDPFCSTTCQVVHDSRVTIPTTDSERAERLKQWYPVVS